MIVIPGSREHTTNTDFETGDIHIRKADNIPLPNTWDKIPAIHRGRHIFPKSSEDLLFAVELPLYRAARLLYDAGIKTTESNAHFEPGTTETKIVLGIDWNSLNAPQKRYALELCEQEPDKWKHYTAAEHADEYESLYLEWQIQKDAVTPQAVKAYVDYRVQNLVNKIEIKVPQKN